LHGVRPNVVPAKLPVVVDVGCWKVIVLEKPSVLVPPVVDDVDGVNDVDDVVGDGEVGDSASVDGVRTLDVAGLGDNAIALPVVPPGELGDPAIGEATVPGVVAVIPTAGVEGGGNDDVNDPAGKSCDDALDVVEGVAESVDAGGGGDVSGGVKKIDPLGDAPDVPENAVGMHGGDV
jgi:hypothetical protein